ncbi:hypothetical protein JCM9279_005553 [Rhodotorula babjevae]
MPGQGSLTAIDAFGVGLMAAVHARKSAHQNQATLPLFAFDGMLGVVTRYLDLVAHHSNSEHQLRVSSSHLVTDALLYPAAVAIEIRFDDDGSYRQTHEAGVQLLDDLVAGTAEPGEEALSGKVFRYRHILEEEKRASSDRGKPFTIAVIPAAALHRFVCSYTFANLSVQSASNLPRHDLHLSAFLEAELRKLGLPSLTVLALDPTSIAFWALEHVASRRKAPHELLFLLRVIMAFEVEFSEVGLPQQWLAAGSWYGCLATLSPEQMRVLQKGAAAICSPRVIATVASWEATMRGRPLEPLVERYGDALALYASIVNDTTKYAKSLGEGGIDLEHAHSARSSSPASLAAQVTDLVSTVEQYPFFPSTFRRPSVPSSRTLKNVETYRERVHARHVSAVPEELDSARSSVHGPHPGLRVSIEPNALTRKKWAEEADAWVAPSALEPSYNEPADIDLSASESGSPMASRRPSAFSAYEPVPRRPSHASSSHAPASPTNYFDPRRTSNLWPTNEELGPPSSSPEVSPRQVRKKRSVLNIFRRNGSGA